MRKGLQIALGILSLIPISFAILGVVTGTGFFVEANVNVARLDNMFRYLSGTYILVTLLLWWAIPQIERVGTLLSLICVALVLGGIGRLVSVMTVGPGDAMQFAGMVLELGSPLFLLWQRAVARQYASSQ